MTTETPQTQANPLAVPSAPLEATPTFAMLRSLGLISMISGLLVALAYEVTAPIIAEGHRLATEQAVLGVIPGAVTKRDFILGPEGLVPADQAPGTSGETLYAAFDAQGQLKGVAITGIGNGYAGPVEVMFAYDPSRQAIVGSKVQKSNETPGFGDKLDTDPTFLRNFKALDVRLATEGKALAHPIVTVKHGTKTDPWQIDAITGATISSRAMGKAANQAAQRAVPAIQRDLAILSQPH
jgi:Na+-translocating ferredoxin:NAD+ oxidoreductase subunit G